MAEKLVVLCERLLYLKREINYHLKERSTVVTASSSNGHGSSKSRAKCSNTGKYEGIISKASGEHGTLRVAGDVDDLDMPKLLAKNQRPTLLMAKEQLPRE